MAHRGVVALQSAETPRFARAYAGKTLPCRSVH